MEFETFFNLTVQNFVHGSKQILVIKHTLKPIRSERVMFEWLWDSGKPHTEQVDSSNQVVIYFALERVSERKIKATLKRENQHKI